jgi:hypothetical protein
MQLLVEEMPIWIFTTLESFVVSDYKIGLRKLSII